jgi:hypothetical protein
LVKYQSSKREAPCAFCVRAPSPSEINPSTDVVSQTFSSSCSARFGANVEATRPTRPAESHTDNPNRIRSIFHPNCSRGRVERLFSHDSCRECPRARVIRVDSG